MNYIKQLRYGFLLAALFLCVGTASAQGPVNDEATTTSSLAASATFQTALRLDISTATSGAVVSGSAGVYTIDLGNVNGLGIGTPATNVSKVAVSTTGWMYTTPIRLTPGFTGFSGSTATITVAQATSDDSASQAAAREGADAESVETIPLVSGTARNVTSAAANGTAFDRYVGVFVPNSNGGNAVAGAHSINLVYTITVP